jgi:enoyl-CoA hydratase/carnithine racemase
LPPVPDSDLVLVDDIARVRLLTLNRPEKANAFSINLYDACTEVLRAAGEDDAVSVVVFTGAGKTYSAGVDINEMSAQIPGDGADAAAPRDRSESGRAFDAFVNGVASFPKPLLAAVNGAAVGIGFTMLLHCDVVLVSELARLRAPFTRMGVAPEAASSFLLARRMGRQRAALALFTSDWIAPQEAVDAGLAVKVCPADRLVSDAVEIATRIAEHPLPSLMETKRLVIDAERDHIARAKELEGAAFARLLSLPDARGRVAAQLDKGTR